MKPDKKRFHRVAAEVGVRANDWGLNRVGVGARSVYISIASAYNAT